MPPVALQGQTVGSPPSRIIPWPHPYDRSIFIEAFHTTHTRSAAQRMQKIS
jgi:hypothetical protein